LRFATTSLLIPFRFAGFIEIAFSAQPTRALGQETKK
jgi:hypothetical protein